MTAELLHALIWMARTGLRARGDAVLVGHGFADPNYRPPYLPYVSLTGPLDVRTESERDPARKRFVLIQMPGHVAGANRAGAAIPGPGQLHLRLDGDARASVAVGFGALAGAAFDEGDHGDQVAAAIQAALIGAAFTDEAGIPITDPARLAELQATTARWDRARTRLVLASGRRGTLTAVEAARPSSVEILPGPDDLAAALGFAAPEVRATGRIVRNEVPAPTAMALDVRIDLWARSQSQLAVMSDTWIRSVPTRAELAVRPAVLADDLADDATRIRLRTPGEPRTRWSLVHLEGTVVDRISGETLALAGATVGAGGLRMTGAQTARLTFHRLPAVPSPTFPDHPGRDGYALSIGVRTDPGGADGDTTRLASVEHGGRVALRLALAWIQDADGMSVELQGTAELEEGGVFRTASTTWRLPAERFDRGAVVHAAIDAATGVIRLFVDGRGPSPGDATETPTPPIAAPGRPVGGTGMTLVLGDPGGADVGFTCDHVHLHGEPLGPLDPRLRDTASPSSAFAIGDPITLVRTEDGVHGTGTPFTVNVIDVDGDEVVVDRPLGAAFPAGSTLVCKRRLFFSQRQIRRRDDLMNRLYRLSFEYRVSALLEERLGDLSVPLVETPDVIVRDLTRLRFELAVEAGEPADPPSPAGAGAPGSTSADGPPPEPSPVPIDTF